MKSVEKESIRSGFAGLVYSKHSRVPQRVQTRMRRDSAPAVPPSKLVQNRHVPESLNRERRQLLDKSSHGPIANSPLQLHNVGAVQSAACIRPYSARVHSSGS